MCVGAMVHARIGTLIYGAPEPKTGAVRSTHEARRRSELEPSDHSGGGGDGGGVPRAACRSSSRKSEERKRSNRCHGMLLVAALVAVVVRARRVCAGA